MCTCACVCVCVHMCVHVYVCRTCVCVYVFSALSLNFSLCLEILTPLAPGYFLLLASVANVGMLCSISIWIVLLYRLIIIVLLLFIYDNCY